jgi:hypothetical protein
MEVHHHPDLHHQPKKWKEYFREFLMLFLAVFCGFLAENVREHGVEQRWANKYAQNLYNELKKDTSMLNYQITFTQTLTEKLDTLSVLANEKSPETSNGMLYWYSNFAGKLAQFSSSSSTIGQLNSSGNLRIMKTNVVLKITDYDKLFKGLANEYAFSRAEYETMNQLRLKIFDVVFAEKFNPSIIGQHISTDSILKLDHPLLNHDPKLMKEFANWAKWSSLLYQRQVKYWLMPLNTNAVELIVLLQKEYHLENE